LRRFATDLQQQMSTLRETTYGSVSTVTSLLKQARTSRILNRTRKESDPAGRVIVDQLLRQRDLSTLARSKEQLAALNRRLSQMIADTTQLVELGSVLARSAKIEAAYGGGFSASLMQVSSDFERTIGDIQHSLEKLTKHHGDSRA
jgi:hypothetical protein